MREISENIGKLHHVKPLGSVTLRVNLCFKIYETQKILNKIVINVL